MLFYVSSNSWKAIKAFDFLVVAIVSLRKGNKGRKTWNSEFILLLLPSLSCIMIFRIDLHCITLNITFIPLPLQKESGGGIKLSGSNINGVWRVVI